MMGLLEKQELLRIHGEYFFWLITPPKDLTDDPQLLCFEDFDTNKGRYTLDLVLTCKNIFALISPFINEHFIFRSKEDGPFKYYKPCRVNLWNYKAIPHMPPSLTDLYVSDSLLSSPSSITNLSEDLSLPTSLKYLNIQVNINIPPLPPNLEEFHLEVPSLSCPIPSFPSSLTSLSIMLQKTNHYYKPLFPTQLKQLYLSHLPSGAILPPALTHLYLIEEITKNFQRNFPPSLKHLSICLHNYLNSPWPSLLTHLHLSVYNIENVNTFEEFPATLTHLTIKVYDSERIYADNYLKIDNLPPSLVFLEIDAVGKISYYPPALHYLQFSTYNHQFTSPPQFPPLPPFLTHLSYASYSEELIALPDSIKYLEFDAPLTFPLPSHLCKLIYNNHDDSPSPSFVFPSGLRHLHCFEKWYDNNNVQNILPENCNVHFLEDWHRK